MKPLSVGLSALLADVSLCLNHYRLASPGVYCCIHAEVELGSGFRFTPGVTLMVNHGRHRNATPEPDYELFRGSPNFIADVFADETDPEYELRATSCGEQNVHEYLAVFDTDPLTWKWHSRDEAGFGDLLPDKDEVLRSRAMPGLWIATTAFSSRNWWAIMASTTLGITRCGHHDFMDSIWNAGKANR